MHRCYMTTMVRTNFLITSSFLDECIFLKSPIACVFIALH